MRKRVGQSDVRRLLKICIFRTLGMNFILWRTRSCCVRQITTVPRPKVKKEENIF